MKIHILAICGVMTTPLALELKKQGHQVSGSEQDKIYPPFSTQLQKAKIPINQTPINSKIDLYIIGSAYKNIPKTLNEFEQITKQKLKYISATNYIAQYIAKNESILIAGSYGKTTITALCVWILKNAQLKPSYMIGGQPINNFPSLEISDSPWSVIEADESINGLDTKAKFLYYPVKHVIITSTNWEHKDCYPTNKDNLNAYKNLIQKIPKDGFLIYNQFDSALKKLTKYCIGTSIPYQTKTNIPNKLIGQFNQENISAASTLCHHMGIPLKIITQSISGYLGIKRRLETIGDYQNILFIDDFAQNPNRIYSTINAIKQQYPKHPIKVYFEPHASFILTKTGLKGFKQAFSHVQEVILSQIPYKNTISKTKRSTAKDFKSEIGDKLIYLPLNQTIEKHFINSLNKQDILVHFSSGGLDGLNTLKKIINYYKLKK